MALTLLADNDIIGPVIRIVRAMQGPEWETFWSALGLSLVTFHDLGLHPVAPDAEVWNVVQDRGIYLITANRSGSDTTSLDATIRNQSHEHSLPVFTLGSVSRLRSDPEYANRVVEKLYQYLLDGEAIRGTGRLYLP